MTEESDRPRILKAIKKVLSDTYDHMQDAMEALDDIGRGSLGAGMSPLVGGYAMREPKEKFRSALISIDSAEKALAPLAKRLEDGRVNDSHFNDEKAISVLRDVIVADYDQMVARLSRGEARESSWYRLRELSEKIKDVFELVADH
ncbi:MAG: hypothetical protein JSW61_11935 [Candidatus Thorarchaeota archaeon]|nr:MAG: hypothetical protein JSW61_11935 [Candidatus Thorarchaeota archaeon]